MTKIKLNPTIESIHGKIGGFVFRRTPSGKMSLIMLADMSKVVWSKAQQDHRHRFREANAYAKAAMADETIRLHYEKVARQSGKRAYHSAVSDYFKGINLLSNPGNGSNPSAKN